MKNLQSFEEFLNESKLTNVKGELAVERYKEDEVFYVNTKEYGFLYLTDKFEKTIGISKLNSLIGKTHVWEIIEWNFSAKSPIEKYKINALVK